MKFNVEDLLEQESLSFHRTSGVFEISKIESKIAGLGFSFRDKTNPSHFVICADAGSCEAFKARREAHPEAGFPYVLLVEAHPDEVLVCPVSDSPGLRKLSREFIQWMLDTYDNCQIVNDDGGDMSEEHRFTRNKT